MTVVDDATLLMIDWPAPRALPTEIEDALRALGARALAEGVYLIPEAPAGPQVITDLRARIAGRGGVSWVGRVRGFDGR